MHLILDTPHSYSAPGRGPHRTLPRPCKRTRMDHAPMLLSDICSGPRDRTANNPHSPDSAPDVRDTFDQTLECTCRLAALPPLPLPHETPSPQSQQTQQRRFIAAWAPNRSQPQPSPPDATIAASPACTHGGGGCDHCMPGDEGPQATALSNPHAPAPTGPTLPTYTPLAQQHAYHPNMNPVSPRRALSPPTRSALQDNLGTCGIAAPVGHADPSVPSALLVAATAAAGHGGTAPGAQPAHPMQASGESLNNDAHLVARMASGFINPGGTASVEEGAEGGPAPDEDGGVVLAQASTSGGVEATDADRLAAWELTLYAAAGWRAPVLPPVTTGQPTALEPCTYGTGPCIAVAGSCAMGMVRATGAVWPQRKALNVIVQNGRETAHSQPVGGFDYANMWRVVGDTLEWPGQAPAPPGTAACGSDLPLGAACGSIESGASLLAGPGSRPQSSLPSNVVTTGNTIERVLAPLSPTAGGGSNGGGPLAATGSGPSSVRQSPGGPVPYNVHPEQPQPHAPSQEQPWPYSTGPALGAAPIMGGGLEGAAPMSRLVGLMGTRPGLAPNAVTTGAAPVSAAAEALAAGAVSQKRLGSSSGGGRDGFSRACVVVGAHGPSGEECSEDGSSSSEGEEEEEEEGQDGGAHDEATSSSASRGGLGGGGLGAVEDVGIGTDWQQPQQQQRPLPLAAHQLESLSHQQALPCPATPAPICHAVQQSIPYPYAAPPVPYTGAPAYRSRYIPGMSGGCWVPSAGAFVPPLPMAPLGAVGGHCAPYGGDKGSSACGGESKGEGQASHRAGPQVAAHVDCVNASSNRGPPETPVAMGGLHLSYTCYGSTGVVCGGGPHGPSAAGTSITPPQTRHMPGPTYGTVSPQHKFECCVCAKLYLPPSNAAVQQSSGKRCRRRLFTTAEEPVWPAGMSYIGVGDLPTQHPMRPGSPGPTCPRASTAAVVAAAAAAVSAATAAHQAVAANAAPAIETAADGHQRCEDSTPPSGNAAQYCNSWLGPWSAAATTRQHLSASGATPTHPPPHYPQPSIQQETQPQPQPHPQPQQQPHAQPQQQSQPQLQQMPAWAYIGMYAAPKPYGERDNSYGHGRRGPSGRQRDAGNYEREDYGGEGSAVGSRRSSYGSGDAAAVLAEAAVGVPAHFESGAPEPVGRRKPQRYSADAAMANGDGWSAPPAPPHGNGTAGRLPYDGPATNSVGMAVAQSVSGGADGTSYIGLCECTACMQARALAGQGIVQSAAPDDTPTVYGTVMAALPPPPPPHAAGGPTSSSWSAPLVHSVSVFQPPPYNGCTCELCRGALAVGHNPPSRLRSFISRQIPSGPMSPPASHRLYHHHHHHHRYQHQPHHQSHPLPYLPPHPPPPHPMQTQAPLNSTYPSYSTHVPAYPPPGPAYGHAPSRRFHNPPPPPPSSFPSYSTLVGWPTGGPAGMPPSKAKTHASDVTVPPPPASSAPLCPCPVCKAAVPSHHHSQQPRPKHPGSPAEPPTTAQQAPAPITAQTTAPAPNESRPRDGLGHLARDRPDDTSCGAGAPGTSHGSVLCADDATSAATGTHTHAPSRSPPPLSAPTPFASSQPLSGPTAGPSTVSQSPHCWASAAATCTAVRPAMAPPMQRPPYTHPSYSHGSYAVPSTAPLPMGPTHRPVEPTAHALRSSVYTSHPASHPSSPTLPSAEPTPHAPAAAAAAGAAPGAGAASPCPPWRPSTQLPSHPSSQNMCSRVSVPPVRHQFDTPTASQQHVQPLPDNRLHGGPAWMPPPHRAAQQPNYYNHQHLMESQAASCPHQPPTPARTESFHAASFSNPMASSQTTLLTMTAAGPAAPVTQSAQAPPRHTAAGHLPYGHMQAPPPPSQQPAVQPLVPPSPSFMPSARHAHTSDTTVPVCRNSLPQHHQQHHLQCYQQTAAPPTCPPKALLASYPHHHHQPRHLPSHAPQHPQHSPPPPPRQQSAYTPAQAPITRSAGSATPPHPSPPQAQPPAPSAPTQPPPLTALGTVTCSTMGLTSGCSRPGFCDHCGSAIVEPAQLPVAAGISCGLQTPVGMMSPPQPQPHSSPHCYNHHQYHNHHNHQNQNRQNSNHQSRPQREGEVVRAQHTAGMMIDGCEQPPPPPPQAQAAPLSSEHPHATEPEQLGAKEQLGERGMPLQPQQLQHLKRQEQQQQQLQHLHHQQQQQQQQQDCSHHYRQQQAIVTLWEQGVPVQQQRHVDVPAMELGNGGKVHEEEDAMWADNPLAAWPGRARRSVLSGLANV